MIKDEIVCYQTGVDVLGFPIIMEHTIKHETQSKFIKKNRVLNVIQRLFKQH